MAIASSQIGTDHHQPMNQPTASATTSAMPTNSQPSRSDFFRSLPGHFGLSQTMLETFFSVAGIGPPPFC